MRIHADPDPPPYFLRKKKKTQWYGITKFSLIFYQHCGAGPPFRALNTAQALDEDIGSQKYWQQSQL